MTRSAVFSVALFGAFNVSCSQPGSSKEASKQGQGAGEESVTSVRPDKEKTMQTQSCASALKALAELRFEEWIGLPTDCSRDDLAKQFEPTGGRGTFVLGSKRTSAEFEQLSFPIGTEHLKLWMVDSKVAMVELANPKIQLKELLEKLGEPDAKLEFAWDVLTLKGEWVWPKRGLTLFVNPENHEPLGVAVYPATTVEAYVEGIQVDRTVREFEP